MVCNVLHGALLLLFIATLTPVRGLPVEDKPSCSPHLMAPNGSEMEMDIYTYYKSDYPGCLGLFLSNIFNSKRGEHVLNELVLKKEDGALICNGFVRLLSLINAYGLTPKMCNGKALANEEREFCTKTYPLKRAQISELASRLVTIGDSGLRDMARVLLSLEDHCEDVCDRIFDSALCGGFVDAGLFFMANYDTAVKNKAGVPSGTKSESGEQHRTGTEQHGTETEQHGTGTEQHGTETEQHGTGTEQHGTGTEQHGTGTEQSSLKSKSGEEQNVATLPDSQSTVRTQPAQQTTDSNPTLSPKLKYFKEHPDEKFLDKQKSSSSPLGKKDQSRYEQTNVLPQEVAGGDKISTTAGSEEQLPPDQEDNEEQLGNVSELSKNDQSQQHEPLVTSSETPAVTSSETPPAEGAEPPPAEGAETPAVTSSETPPAEGAEPPPAEGAETPAVTSSETPAVTSSETPPAEGAEPPPAEGAETPAVTSSETPTVASAETPPAEGAEPPPAEGAETHLNEGDKPPTDASDETPLDEGDKGDETLLDVSDETPPAEDIETGGPLYDDDEESNTQYEEAVYDDSLDDNETEEALEKEMEEFYEEEYEEENAKMDGGPAPKKPPKPKGKTQMVGEIYISDEEETSSKSSGGHGSWHFFTIFLFVAILSIVGYLCVYNRKKIREGVSSYMSDKNRRRRGREYKPLLSAQT